MVKITSNIFEGDMSPWIIEQGLGGLTAGVYLTETFNSKGLNEEEVEEHKGAIYTVLTSSGRLVAMACGKEWQESYLEMFILEGTGGLEKFLVEMGLMNITTEEAINQEAEKLVAHLANFAFEPKAIAKERTQEKLIADGIDEETAKKIAKRMSEVVEGKLAWKDFAIEATKIIAAQTTKDL
ncbi:MAG: hypothetical protein FWF37_01270 [Chloroflexi bacterium]|nr:hypothetical protein [Chloroflexota bacterium]